MFGKNTEGQSCSIVVPDYKPFFYIKVHDDSWGNTERTMFLDHLKKKKVGKYHEKSIVECKIVKKNSKKNYMSLMVVKKHTFILISFENLQVFNKVKNLWYHQDRTLI